MPTTYIHFSMTRHFLAVPSLRKTTWPTLALQFEGVSSKGSHLLWRFTTQFIEVYYSNELFPTDFWQDPKFGDIHETEMFTSADLFQKISRRGTITKRPGGVDDAQPLSRSQKVEGSLKICLVFNPYVVAHI